VRQGVGNMREVVKEGEDVGQKREEVDGGK
jgi:hypothetical protein